MNIVPTPWRLVQPCSVILGRDGRPVMIDAVVPHSQPGMCWVEWERGWVARPLEEVVPVVHHGLNEALANIFRAFPQAQVLKIEG